MIGKEYIGVNPDIKVMRVSARTGIGNRLQTDAKESNTDYSHLESLGLFRKGIHLDTRITATGPNGDNVDINVNPLPVKEGTIFVPEKGQGDLLKVLFPQTQGKRGAMFRNRE